MENNPIQGSLFEELDGHFFRENRENKTGKIHKYVATSMPVGKKGEVRRVPSQGMVNIDKHNVTYTFGNDVTDIAVKSWVLALKIYFDANYSQIERIKKMSAMKACHEYHVANLRGAELADRIYGTGSEARLVYEALKAIKGIDVVINVDGKEMGSTNFISAITRTNGYEEIKISFNSFMMYALMQKYKTISMDKYLSLKGRASRLYGVMQGTKFNGKYQKISHRDLCFGMNMDYKSRVTKGRLRKDFIAIDIDFEYRKRSDDWYWKVSKK